MPLSLVGQQVGNYKIEKPLGEGGMGVVYLGEHPLIGKKASPAVPGTMATMFWYAMSLTALVSEKNRATTTSAHVICSRHLWTLRSRAQVPMGCDRSRQEIPRSPSGLGSQPRSPRQQVDVAQV